MDALSETLVNEVFVLAWLILPLLVIQYRFTSVRHRMDEVKDAFLGRDAYSHRQRSYPGIIGSVAEWWNQVRFGKPRSEINTEKDTVPAWHYLKSLRPLEAERYKGSMVPRDRLLEPIDEQFQLLHGG